jgi:SAM-dependent methyltransferase
VTHEPTPAPAAIPPTAPEAPDRDDRRRRWDERHAAHDPIEHAEADPTLVATCTGLRPGRALDLGAGDGRNAIWLALQGWQVTAVDFSAVAIDRAGARAARAGATVDWQLHDLLEWSPEPAAYELVVLVFIQLPPDERRMVYANAAAAVAPGGSLLVIAHDRSNLEKGVGGPQHPEVLFTAPEIAGELPAGFEIRRAEPVRRGPDGERVPIDAVLVATRAGSPPDPRGRR